MNPPAPMPIPCPSQRFPLIVALLPLLLASCISGPDYHKPEVISPPGWGWKLAEPHDQVIKDDWWQLFNDPLLNKLETQATAASPLLQTAVARVDQARAQAGIASSRFFPQLAFDPSVSRFHTQKNHVPSNLTATATTLPLDLSYEVDLWGKIRRSLEAAHAQAESNVASYYQVLLTLHGDVASNYFLLRQLDTQITLLEWTQDLRQRGTLIVEERFHAGMAPELDLDRARTEFAQTKTLVIETQRQRAHLQDAIALLCGQPAPSFHIAPGALPESLPKIPSGLPSQLLERRPDVAEAERKMAAANAQIGVAKAAFFPALSLTGNAGYSSFHTSSLLDWQSQLFQIGPSVALPILNGSRIKAGVQEARAAYQAACGNYQRQVLTAFKDVSDALVDLDSYHQQAATEGEALTSAKRAAGSSRERYGQGLVNYLDVLDAERTQLQTELQTTQILASRLIATIHLVKALGGGFDQRAWKQQG